MLTLRIFEYLNADLIGLRNAFDSVFSNKYLPFKFHFILVNCRDVLENLRWKTRSVDSNYFSQFNFIQHAYKLFKFDYVSLHETSHFMSHTKSNSPFNNDLKYAPSIEVSSPLSYIGTRDAFQSLYDMAISLKCFFYGNIFDDNVLHVMLGFLLPANVHLINHLPVYTLIIKRLFNHEWFKCNDASYTLNQSTTKTKNQRRKRSVASEDGSLSLKKTCKSKKV
jgi:hypothetical protein